MNRFKILFGLTIAMFLVATGCAGAKMAVPSLPESMDMTGSTSLEKKMMSAAVLLYGMNEEGDLRFTCTATAFERNENTYRFVTASHCVSEDNTRSGRVVMAPTSWYLLLKESKVQKYYGAKVIAAGYQSRGDDLAVLEAELDVEIPVIPLAETDGTVGESVSIVAGPYGLGKQLFRGHVTMSYLNRPIRGRTLNWEGVTLLQISSGPGASGSSVVSSHREKIIAILVGRIGSSRGTPAIATVPVSRLHAFLNAVDQGKYPWFGTRSSSGIYTNLVFGDEAMLKRILEPKIEE